MHLARHSDPKLTLARYGRPQIADLAERVKQLPSLTCDPLASQAAAAGGQEKADAGLSTRPAKR